MFYRGSWTGATVVESRNFGYLCALVYSSYFNLTAMLYPFKVQVIQLNWSVAAENAKTSEEERIWSLGHWTVACLTWLKPGLMTVAPPGGLVQP